MRVLLATLLRGALIALASVMLWLVILICMAYDASEVVMIQLNANEWTCEALDPVDGECASWLKTPQNPH